ncbi:MAG TPA: AarF/ABC1/UbiB kinase family protein [Candidatus Limnocylindria bacterium]|nr:AarF/ABC1/UbiB kinase family protein [Candidatus Limnocylindria bacterium]
MRHGLGFLVDALGLDRVIPFHRGLLGHPKRAEPYTRPEHVRMALEDLGPTFVKLGQIASTHGDLLRPDYQHELARLQDGVAPAPTDSIRAAIEAELGASIETAFASFGDEPVAAASIGQAHAARLHDGTEAIVKVRRPGVIANVRSDLTLIRSLANAASTRSALAERYDVVGIVDEFAATLLAELDYEREAESIARFAANFAGDPTVRIPSVFRQVSGDGVLTLERLRGIRIDDLAALDAAGIDRAALAARTSRMLMKMVFEDGFFHADPHPGNLFVESDGRIGLIDFGMTGTIDETTRDRLVDVLLALTGRDPSRLADAFLALGFARGRVDRTLLERDLARLIAPYYERALGDISIGALLQETLEVIRRHRLVLPRELALLVKTLIMSDGIATHLAPDFKLMTVLIPYAKRMLARRLSPEVLGPRLAGAATEAARLALTLPRRVDQLLGALERGDLEIPIRPAGFEPIAERFERSADRVVLGIVAAAFMNGLAVFVSVYHPAGWQAQAPLALIFGLAAGIGAYLVRSVMRPARR